MMWCNWCILTDLSFKNTNSKITNKSNTLNSSYNSYVFLHYKPNKVENTCNVPIVKCWTFADICKIW